MRAFSYHIATDAPQASGLASKIDAPQFLAGGTTLVDLMKLDVLTPSNVIDINSLSNKHGKITIDSSGLHLGAFVRMSEAASNKNILKDYPGIADSLKLAASQQLRNMASLGGNVLQRTRCPYFRDPTYEACNKRSPGSGCAAMEGVNRSHAIFGTSESCIATYPGDFGVMLAALDATVIIQNGDAIRKIPFSELHRLPENTPNIETSLAHNEIITGFDIPAGAWTRRSLYLKIRDRESYEFALVSAAVALDIQGGIVREARIALGGVATKPWRAKNAEALLIGKALTEANATQAAKVAFEGAITHRDNAFKPELGSRALVRALLQSASMEVSL